MNNSQPSASEHLPMWTEWAISVLNGIIGDYLGERCNGLAIEMAFYHQNRPLPLTPENLLLAHPNPTAKLCVLLHGLGCNEGIWAFRDSAQRYPDTSYGTLLHQELGYTPFYLRYNTGLAIAENGNRLAALLDELLACYPVSVNDIVLIGHSMGGLVLRSACHSAARHQYAWVGKIRQVFYLGTPHEGADLEKLGGVAVAALRAIPNPITRLIGNILNLRSEGVKDLQSGNLLARDPIENTPDGLPADQPRGVPWLTSAHHYLIAGTLTEDPQHALSRLFGDALVKPLRVPGRPGQCSGVSSVPHQNIKVFARIHHMELAHNLKVYHQIRQWCSSERSRDLFHG